MEKIRVLYVLHEFPQISQTYIKTELEALQHDYDIRVLTRNAAHDPYRDHYPFTEIKDLEAIREELTNSDRISCTATTCIRPTTSRSWPNRFRSSLPCGALIRRDQAPWTVGDTGEGGRQDAQPEARSRRWAHQADGSTHQR
jgi:hypothetical protein